MSRAEIRRTVEVAAGRSVMTTQRIIRGDEYEVHRVRLLDDSTVYLRVTLPGTPISMADHEAWAMGRARDNGVPAPEILGVSVIDGGDRPRAAMVVRACSGRPLAEVMPSLRPDERATALADIGRVLAVLHSKSMPGVGRPDADRVWPDPHQAAEQYVATCLAATEQLSVAGLTWQEIDRVTEVLRQDEPIAEDPVLCHGDVSPEHVFVADDLSVVGLIDWGMWSAGPGVAELANLSVRNSRADYDAIAVGYGPADIRASSLRWHAIAQLVGQINWLITSRQSDELEHPTIALRRLLPVDVR